MKSCIYRYIIFLLIAVLASGCILTNAQSAKDQEAGLNGLGGNPAPQNNEEVNEAISEKVSSDGNDAEPAGDSTTTDIVNNDKESTEHIPADNSEYVETINGDISMVSGNGPLISRDAKESTGVEKENSVENAQNSLDTALEFYEASQEFWAEGNLEKSIETLDQAYAYILKVDTYNNSELVQPVEDLRFMISKRILEIYASRYVAVNGIHQEIPLIMNKHVEKEIKLFQGEQRKFFIESYRRSGKYRGEIVKALKEAGLPEELSWLPLIESGFKVRALSRARALGLWQFIPSTGYKYGLKRDVWIDERLDPEKSTAAAIAYLKELHQIFGDWTTVLAGYNCGEVRVLKVIRSQKINYLDDFWDLYQRLPYETARYVPRFIATLHILDDPEKYGFDDLGEPDEPIPYEVISIEKQVHLKKVAERLGISYEVLSELNPELRYKATPATVYYLKVSHGMGLLLLAMLDDIPKWSPPQTAYTYHRVRKGETLSLIAQRYRTSVRSIVRVNNLRSVHFIRVGQKLKIPLRGGWRSSTVASADLLPDGRYLVRRGDSLWLIAQRFNTSPEKLKHINGLTSTRLMIGQILKIKN